MEEKYHQRSIVDFSSCYVGGIADDQASEIKSVFEVFKQQELESELPTIFENELESDEEEAYLDKRKEERGIERSMTI